MTDELIPQIHSQCAKGKKERKEGAFGLVPHGGNIGQAHRDLNEHCCGALHFIRDGVDQKAWCWVWLITKEKKKKNKTSRMNEFSVLKYATEQTE